MTEPVDEMLSLADIDREQGWQPHTTAAYLSRSRARRAAGIDHPSNLDEPDHYEAGKPRWRRSTVVAWLDRRPRAGKARRAVSDQPASTGDPERDAA